TVDNTGAFMAQHLFELFDHAEHVFDLADCTTIGSTEDSVIRNVIHDIGIVEDLIRAGYLHVDREARPRIRGDLESCGARATDDAMGSGGIAAGKVRQAAVQEIYSLGF